jgi:hypothetical protein
MWFVILYLSAAYASTASSAARLPWISAMMAMRMVVLLHGAG